MNEAAGRWKKVEALYNEAAALDEGRRRAFLDSACEGDESLRRELESLLGYDGQLAGFLEEPALEQAARAAADVDGHARPEPTSLPVGTRLGVYEILAAVGAGGMGEVYRARDGRLGRDVAVKVLPGNVSSPERRKRFEREARAAGALNHPNVLTVYDVGAHDGAPYLVTELLEGETLRARLHGSGLAPREALAVAGQLATGLSAMHEKGIVHRDLKPENVFLTRDGRAKILDFGLAHVTGPQGIELDAETETSPERLTASGVLVGTMAYMSPEQARGLAADARSDVFALGTVLFEMLTGRRPFEGATPSDVLSAILREDPPPIDTGALGLPPALDRVVRRCLEKDPAQRFQAARDVAFAIEAISAPAEAGPAPSSGPPVAPSTAAGRWRRPVASVLLAAALVSGVAVAAFLAGQGRGDKSTPSYHRLTFRRGKLWGARFARDGQTIVYGAAWEGEPVRLFTTRADSPESRTFDLPDADILAISSRDEMAILLDRAYGSPGAFSAGTLARVPLAGGAPRVVLEGVYDADWSPDGGDLAVVRSAGQAWQAWPVKRRLEFPIGKVLFETEGTLSSPRVSPRGDLVAFVGDQGVSLVDRAGKMRTLAPTTHCFGLAWSPSGDEVWYTESVHQPVLLQAVSLARRPRLLDHYSGATFLRDVSRDGRALMTFGALNLGLAGRRSGEARDRDLSWFDGSQMINLSADGELILFTERWGGVGGSPVAYVRRTDGSSPPVRIGEGFATRLSADGKWVIAHRDHRQIVLLPTGSGEAKVLESSAMEPQWTVFSADGKQVVIAGAEPGRPNRTWIQDIAGGRQRPVTPEGVIGLPTPDGRSLIAWDAARRLSLYPVDGGNPRPVPGAPEPGYLTAWAEDGHSMFVTEGRGPAALVFKRDITTGSRTPWMTIEPPDPAGVYLVNPDLTADGKSYVYSYTRHLSSLYLIDGLK